MKGLPIPPHRVCLLLALALVLAGCSAGGQEAPTPTPVPQVVSQEKIVFTVEKGPIVSKRDIYGEVVPARQDALFFRASGYINRVTVKDGDRVRKGDVMAELQIDDLLSQLEQARIDLQTAQDNLDAEQLQQAYELQKAESDVAILQIQVEQAGKRLEELYGRQKEDAQAELQMLQERLKTAQAYLELVRGRKDTGSQALVDRSRLSVERLERLVSERQIVAPYDGLVLTSFLKPGNNIDAFTTAFEVGDPSSLVIRISYDFQLSSILEPSTEASLSLTRSKEKLYPVKFLQDFLPITNNQGGLTTSGDQISLNYFYFSAPADLPLDQLPLGGGVTLEVVLGRKEDALLLPPAAIRGNEAFRYVIVLEDEYHRRVELLSIGLQSDKLWEVIGDLKEGDQVLGP